MAKDSFELHQHCFLNEFNRICNSNAAVLTLNLHNSMRLKLEQLLLIRAVPGHDPNQVCLIQRIRTNQADGFRHGNNRAS